MLFVLIAGAMQYVYIISLCTHDHGSYIRLHIIDSLIYQISAVLININPPPPPPLFCIRICYSSPKIALVETKGLSDVQKTELLKKLDAICAAKRGEVVIYDLTQAVGTFLHKHNKPPAGSFYDQMLIERMERDKALSHIEQQKAHRLSLEQQVNQNEVLKRKEILRNEDRWTRGARRSMSESSPKHRASSYDTELEDSYGDGVHPSNCELHLSSEDMYFASIGRKVRRGSCLGE